jgi:hypothetical protein
MPVAVITPSPLYPPSRGEGGDELKRGFASLGLFSSYYLHFVPGQASFQTHYENDFSAFQDVLFRFSAQSIEVRRFEEESQGFGFLNKFLFGALIQKLAHQLIILPLGLGLHAGIQLRLKLNKDRLFVGYLPHPLTPTIFSGKQIEAERA